MYVSSFRDRHGTERFRFRRKGGITCYLRNKPDSDEFAAEYALLLADTEPPEAATQVAVMRKLMKALEAIRQVEMPSYVYALADPTGPVKIGFASNPVDRLISLQIGNPRRIEVVGLRHGTMRTEADIHRRLAHARIGGEWFEREAVLRIMKWRGVWLTPDSDILSNPAQEADNV